MPSGSPMGLLAAEGFTRDLALASVRPYADAAANLGPVERLAASSVDIRPSYFHAERAKRAQYLSSTFTTAYLCPPPISRLELLVSSHFLRVMALATRCIPSGRWWLRAPSLKLKIKRALLDWRS